MLVSDVRIDVVTSHNLFAYMPWALLAWSSWAVMSYSHTGHERCSHRCRRWSYEILQNRMWNHKVAECIAKCKGINDLWFYGILTAFKPRSGMKPTTRILVWNPPMEILVSAFEIHVCNGLLLSTSYKWLLRVDQAFYESYTCDIFIIGIDYTTSNKVQGMRTFHGNSLHDTTKPKANPYQQVSLCRLSQVTRNNCLTACLASQILGLKVWNFM